MPKIKSPIADKFKFSKRATLTFEKKETFGETFSSKNSIISVKSASRGKAKLQHFLDILDAISKGSVPSTSLKDFEQLYKLDGDTQELVFGVNKYLEMLQHGPSKSDLQNSVEDFIVEKKVL